MTRGPWPQQPPATTAPVSAEPLLTRDYDADPALVHERLRETYGPVAPVDLLGVPVWFVMGYEEVLRVLQNPGGAWSKRLDNWKMNAEGRLPADWPLLPVFQVNNSTFQEGATLNRLRAAWTTALAPFQDYGHPQAQQLEQAVVSHADDLIGVLAEGGAAGWADLAAQYARPLPLMVADRMLGFTAARGEDVVMDIWRMLDAGPDAAAAFERLYAAMTELGAAKRESPGEDLPSYLINAKPDITLDELARELLMLPGLLDFTGSLVCNVVVEVIANAGVRESLSAGAIDEAVNKVALLNPPMANLTFRYALTDVKMGNYTIPAGDPVMLSVAAAHGDPRFAGAIDWHAIRSTRAHLAWGAGPHSCLGQVLATRIAVIAVQRLFRRFSKVKLALPADQLPWRPSPFMRSLRSLPVQYELARVPAPPADTAAAEDSDAQTAATPAAGAASGAASPADEPAGKPSRSPLWSFLRGLRRAR
ncbi:cytochrome P450 [Nonomuraea jiangxiensis]|uniref:Cytochrome P450 n=1 Tax=Nonomuraea jiangxiensis TaxID=633440 RepID=A0A1G9BHJ1_9ACTN|nr:cytochrome P450 [Nonomuraea jiangxiensis]SDK38971.1 Cytochrome P450 [Nonomuraea jiangxiensis]